MKGWCWLPYLQLDATASETIEEVGIEAQTQLLLKILILQGICIQVIVGIEHDATQIVASTKWHQCLSNGTNHRVLKVYNIVVHRDHIVKYINMLLRND